MVEKLKIKKPKITKAPKGKVDQEKNRRYAKSIKAVKLNPLPDAPTVGEVKTRDDLAKYLSFVLGVPDEEVTTLILNLAFGYIYNCVVAGDCFRIPNVGTIGRITYKNRKFRDVRNNKMIVKDVHHACKFWVSKTLRNVFNGIQSPETKLMKMVEEYKITDVTELRRILGISVEDTVQDYSMFPEELDLSIFRENNKEKTPKGTDYNRFKVYIKNKYIKNPNALI